jgi:hypothetical protein
MGTTHKISIKQEKQEGGSILRMTNALKSRILPPILVSLDDGAVIFLLVTEDH